jgi:hypothetical protein
MNKVKPKFKNNTNELSTIYANTKKEGTRIKIQEVIVITYRNINIISNYTFNAFHQLIILNMLKLG